MTTTWTDLSKPAGTAYTDIPKPQFSSVIGISGGTPIGLLLALTYAVHEIITTDPWTDVAEANGTAWGDINKASGTAWGDIAEASGTSWTDVPKAT